MTSISKAMSLGNKSNEIRSVHDFGVKGTGALQNAAQEGTGTGADDGPGLQDACEWVRDTGGSLVFDPSRVYRSDNVLTCLRDSTTGPTNYNFDFGGAAIDFSNLDAGDYFTIGADSLTNIATDVGHINFSKARIFGQQTGNPGSGTAATNTATTGIKTQFAYNVYLERCIAHRCHVGLETMYTFSLVDMQSSFKRNIVGVLIDDVTNDSTWIRTEVAQSRFGLIVQPQGVHDSGKCVNNHFIGFRAEGCEVGAHLDPASNNAGIAVLKDWTFDRPYFSGNTYDHMRLGTVADSTTSSARGANSTDRIFNMKVDGGFWGITPTATKAAIAFSSNNNVRQSIFNIPVDISVPFTIVNAHRNGNTVCVSQPEATSDIAPTTYRYDATGTLYDTDAEETVEGGAHDGSGNAAVLTDSSKSWTVNEWVGRIISNDTDGSAGTITANTATTVTATLAGGTDDDWDVSDAYTLGSALAVAGTSILASTDGAIAATLGDGSVRGQKKSVGFTGANTSTLSVTTHETSSPEVFTFNATTDYLTLVWSGSQWITDLNAGVAT